MIPPQTLPSPGIIYVAREEPVHGRAPALQVTHTLDGLAQAGASVQFVTPWPADRIRRFHRQATGRDLSDAIEIASIGSGPDLPFLWRWWPSPVWSGIRRRLQRHLARCARGGRCVLYTRNRRVAADLADVGMPVVFECHELRALTLAQRDRLPADHPRIRAVRREEMRALRNIRMLVTITRPLADDLVAAYAYHGPVRVIPDGVDPALFAIAPEQRCPQPGRFLYVGSLLAWKGLALALGALRSVPAATLDICGGTPGSRDWALLEDAARRLGVRQRIRMHGTLPQAELRPLMAQAVAGILPLDGRYAIAARHTSPLKLFEYLCAGLPVIATDVPSVRDIVADEREALLFADGDEKALAGAMQRILNDAGLAARLSAAATATSQDYTWRRRGQRIIEACTAAVEGSAGR